MAMKAHAPFLELAAAAIDFDLTDDERASLDAHIAECPACRRAVAAMQADALEITRLPHRPLAPARAERMAADLRRGRPRSRSLVPAARTILIIGLLAMLAVGTIAIGAAWLRRERSELSVIPTTINPPSVVPPSPEPSTDPSPSPTPSRAPSPTPPGPGPGEDVFAEGSILEVVVAGLRVRTAPTTDSARSSYLQPSLGRWVRLEVLGGPVPADGYTWYEVRAIGWPQRGWIASADPDGVPWVAPMRPKPVLTAAQEALVERLVIDPTVRCEPPTTGTTPGSSAGVECQVQSSVITRVLAFAMDDPVAAAAAHHADLARYGVAPDSGDCAADTPGDGPWAVGDDAAVGRIGCFIDENGFAHVRLTCGATYIWVLSTERETRDVFHTVRGDGAADALPALCQGPVTD